MAQVSGIEIAISGNTSGLDRALGKAEGSLNKFAKGALAGIAGALSAGVFVAAGKSAIDFADAVGKTAQKVGSTTKAISELNYAAKISDLTFSDLETGMRFLSKSMVDNADLFNQLGVAIQNSDGSLRSTDQVLMDLADRFASIPDGAQKTALAMELLGRSGASMIPMLNAGSSGLEQMRQRAIDLGLSISEDTSKRAEQFNDTLTDLASVGQGAMMQLASAILPLAQVFLNVSVAGAEAMVKLGSTIQDIAPYAAIAVAAVAGFYAPAVLSGLAATAGGLIAVSNAIKLITVAMLANPIGLIVGALAAASVAAFVFRDNIKSAIGIDVVGVVKDSVNFIIRSFVNFGAYVENLGNIVAAALVGITNATIRAINTMVNGAIKSLNTVVDLANSLSDYTGMKFEPFDPVSISEFENKFADNVKSINELMADMGARAGTDYVGSFTTAVGNAIPKINETLLGGTGGAVAGGDGGSDIKINEGEKDKTSPVPGVAPSQEVDAFYVARLESIRNGFKSEREILEEEYAADMELLRGHLTGKDELDAEYKELMRQRAEQHARDLNQIEYNRIQEDLSQISTGLGSMASAFQNGGKKMLKISKVFAAAQAIVETIKAATQAMADPMAITPAQKFANYALVFAKGMSAVAAIKGVSESGGGGGGGGGGGSTSSSASTSASGGGGGAAPTTTFSFTLMNDPMGFGEKFARQFIDQLNSTQRNGGQIRGVIA